jgi:hypothetical protein
MPKGEAERAARAGLVEVDASSLLPGHRFRVPGDSAAWYEVDRVIPGQGAGAPDFIVRDQDGHPSRLTAPGRVTKLQG